MLDKLIFTSYALIFFLVPLFWTSLNFELFEYNKMMLIYGLTVIIVGIWLLKMVTRKALCVMRTPLDIPLLLFLGANVLSTIFSIDQHTSIWGYYSRSNGGLLSLISYILLYFAFVSNISKEQVFKLLKIGLFSGFLISAWGIFEHFGISISCIILREEFNASCWVQDVQSRVFATLGQPNWMAAYLAMLIFPAFYFFLSSLTTRLRIIYFLLLITYYLAFTFTYSRGGFLGFLAGLSSFTVLTILSSPPASQRGERRPSALRLRLEERGSNKQNEVFNWIPARFAKRAFAGMTEGISIFLKRFSIIIISFLLINLLFGSALTRFNISQFLPKSTSDESEPRSDVRKLTSTTQLESGGTESGQIRLIVWQGALDIFKAFPIFGSGVETFAYSYYQFRPVAHNLVSEWDFLYNKAHNEFLNYLATTGIVGFGTYMLVIGTFILWCFRRFFVIPGETRNLKINHEISYFVRDDKLLIVAILASYISYLVQNFFGFSVVIIAIFFYLFPAISFVASDSTSTFYLPSSKNYLLSSIIHLQNLIYHRPIYTKLIKIFIVLSIFYILYSIFRLWIADTYFASGQRASEAGNPGAAYNFFSDAVALNKFEPFYRSELSFAAAASALALKDTDATLSAQLKYESIQITDQVLENHPKNVSFYRTAVRTYFELSGLDEKYTQKTLETLDKTILLAPTDPKLLYNKAVILGEANPDLIGVNQSEEAIKVLQKAIELKPNYRDGYFALSLFYFDSKQPELAVENMNKILEFIPDDPEALNQLNKWGKMGIATKSAKL